MQVPLAALTCMKEVPSDMHSPCFPFAFSLCQYTRLQAKAPALGSFVTLQAFGWVMEMYSFCLALYKLGMRPHLDVKLQVQPPYEPFEPWLTIPQDAYYLLHYTYNTGVYQNGTVADWGKSCWLGLVSVAK